MHRSKVDQADLGPAGFSNRRHPSAANRSTARQRVIGRALRLKRSSVALPRDKEALPTNRLLARMAAFSGAFLLIGVVSKVLMVSRMDLTVAQILATQSNPSVIIFGSLLLFFPLVPIVGMNVTLLLLMRQWQLAVRGMFNIEQALPVMYAAGAFAIFLVLGAYAMPRVVFLLGLIVTLGAPLGLLTAYALRRLGSRASGRKLSISRIWRANMQKAGLGLAVLYLIGTVFVALPTVINEVVWLPPRQIELTDGRSFVGYEVSRTSEVVALLRDVDRKVVEVSSSAIASANPCRIANLVNTAAPLMPFQRSFFATPSCI